MYRSLRSVGKSQKCTKKLFCTSKQFRKYKKVKKIHSDYRQTNRQIDRQINRHKDSHHISNSLLFKLSTGYMFVEACSTPWRSSQFLWFYFCKLGSFLMRENTWRRKPNVHMATELWQLLHPCKSEKSKTRPTAISCMLSEQYIIKNTKNSEVYGSLRNVWKYQKCMEV